MTGTASSCAREGLNYVSGKNSSLFSPGTNCPASGGVTSLEGFKRQCRCSSWGHSSVVTLAVLKEGLGSMILKGFSNLNHSVVISHSLFLLLFPALPPSLLSTPVTAYSPLNLSLALKKRYFLREIIRAVQECASPVE